MAAEAAEHAHGRAARTVLHGPRMRVVVFGLAEGGELGEHESPWADPLQVLRGEITLRTADESWEMGAGELRCVPRVRHKVLARTPAVVLMTVALGG